MVPTCTTAYTATSVVGSTPATSCSGGAVSSNYSFTYVNGSVTITKAPPTVSWTTPTAITCGTALSAIQLDATSGGVAGSYAYTPSLGTVLTAGSHTLSVAFTPTDTTDYYTAAANVSIAVKPAPPSLNGIYYSLLQAYDLTASSGLSNTSEGVVAAEERVPGTGTIVLPQPIDPTKPWRLNIHFVFNDANPFTIRFQNPANPYSGYVWSSTGSMNLYTGWNNGQYLTYGPLTSIPLGTPMSFTVASDGFGVWPCVIPDTLTTVFSDMSYAANWDGSEYCGEMSASYVDPKYGALNQGLQVVESTLHRNPIRVSIFHQGNLDPPLDREMDAPMILNPAVALDPGGYGPPSRYLSLKRRYSFRGAIVRKVARQLSCTTIRMATTTSTRLLLVRLPRWSTRDTLSSHPTHGSTPSEQITPTASPPTGSALRRTLAQGGRRLGQDQPP